MHRYAFVFMLAVASLVGCSSPVDEDPDADAVETTAAELGGGQIVFVNFDGVHIDDCAEPCSDAPTNQSWAISEHFGKTAIDFLPYRGGRAGRAAILAKLRAIYARYDVTFVTTRPAIGDYTMIVVSATDGPNHGVGPLDCDNANKRDIAFVYRTDETSADFTARAAAHELGHTFGLAHVKSRYDVMDWASRGSRIGTATYDPVHPSAKCFTGSVQDGAALLEGALGLASP